VARVIHFWCRIRPNSASFVYNILHRLIIQSLTCELSPGHNQELELFEDRLPLFLDVTACNRNVPDPTLAAFTNVCFTDFCGLHATIAG
jgi:hypothetical protein